MTEHDALENLRKCRNLPGDETFGVWEATIRAVLDVARAELNHCLQAQHNAERNDDPQAEDNAAIRADTLQDFISRIESVMEGK